MIDWLPPGAPFPPVTQALRAPDGPDGLLCASADLDADRLVDAYRRGIFPWYSPGEPVLWWSPDPRMVLVPAEFRVARSLRKRLRAVADGDAWQVRLDSAFGAVIRACAAPRPGQDGTWITAAVRAAYGELHARGLAHSVEVWAGDALVGGLYGVALGRMFYGESMFARATDASKVALAALVRLLRDEQVPLIDCQQRTAHLASLGGRAIPRAEFQKVIARAAAAAPIDWRARAADPLNPLLLTY